MATKQTVPTVANGDAWSASQQNTFLRDNVEALWPYTTAGDIAYATAANQLGRLGVTGAARKLLRVNAAGTAPEYGQAAFVVKHHHNAAGHTYNSTVERDMPNSSNTITVLVTSTLIVLGRVWAYEGEGNCWFDFKIRVDGTDGNGASQRYSGGISFDVPVFAVKTGVTAGVKTILLREREAYGAGISYGVGRIEWIAVAVPE